jgi:hypothetical protein
MDINDLSVSLENPDNNESCSVNEIETESEGEEEAEEEEEDNPITLQSTILENVYIKPKRLLCSLIE